jgi:hypothetical protein
MSINPMWSFIRKFITTVQTVDWLLKNIWRHPFSSTDHNVERSVTTMNGKHAKIHRRLVPTSARLDKKIPTFHWTQEFRLHNDCALYVLPNTLSFIETQTLNSCYSSRKWRQQIFKMYWLQQVIRHNSRLFSGMCPSSGSLKTPFGNWILFPSSEKVWKVPTPHSPLARNFYLTNLNYDRILFEAFGVSRQMLHSHSCDRPDLTACSQRFRPQLERNSLTQHFAGRIS